MSKFRKKPIVVEAEQFLKDKLPYPNGVFIGGSYCSTEEAGEWCRLHRRYHVYPIYNIQTLEGKLSVSHGDWIITGIRGEKYACKPDIFQATYELACVPAPSNPKEEIIEGLAEWLEHNSHSDPFCPRLPVTHAKWMATQILTSLKEHGFGDIEQAKKDGAKEERERIVTLKEAAEKVVKYHSRFIFEELAEALGNTNTRILKDTIENLKSALEALKQEGK